MTPTTENKTGVSVPAILAGIVSLYAFILVTAAYLPELCPLFLAAGLFLLSPMTLISFRTAPRLLFFGTMAILLIAGLILSPVTGTVLFILCFGAGLVASLLIREAPDTYMLLLKGFGLLLLCAALVLAVLVRARFGVFDFLGAYQWLTEQIIAALNNVAEFYRSVAGEAMEETMRQVTQTLAGMTDALICQMAILAASLMMGQYLWTLVFANTALKKTDCRFPLLPFRYMMVPRSVTVVYILTYFAGFFLSGTSLRYGFDFATTMFGWLLVMCGIGVPDLYLEDRLSAPARMLIKVALLFAAFFSVCFFSGIFYTVLLIIGTFVSASPRGVNPHDFFKRKGR